MDNPYRYSTKEWDEKSGLYYFGARYYSPEIGRWTQRDPKRIADSLNQYVYCTDDPVSRVDAYGLWGTSVDSHPEAIALTVSLAADTGGLINIFPSAQQAANAVVPFVQKGLATLLALDILNMAYDYVCEATYRGPDGRVVVHRPLLPRFSRTVGGASSNGRPPMLRLGYKIATGVTIIVKIAHDVIKDYIETRESVEPKPLDYRPEEEVAPVEVSPPDPTKDVSRDGGGTGLKMLYSY